MNEQQEIQLKNDLLKFMMEETPRMMTENNLEYEIRLLDAVQYLQNIFEKYYGLYTNTME